MYLKTTFDAVNENPKSDQQSRFLNYALMAVLQIRTCTGNVLTVREGSDTQAVQGLPLQK